MAAGGSEGAVGMAVAWPGLWPGVLPGQAGLSSGTSLSPGQLCVLPCQLRPGAWRVAPWQGGHQMLITGMNHIPVILGVQSLCKFFPTAAPLPFWHGCNRSTAFEESSAGRKA